MSTNEETFRREAKVVGLNQLQIDALAIGIFGKKYDRVGNKVVRTITFQDVRELVDAMPIKGRSRSNRVSDIWSFIVNHTSKDVDPKEIDLPAKV